MSVKYRVKVSVVNTENSSEHVVYTEEFMGLLMAHYLARLVKYAFEILRLARVNKE